ncbi:BgTH12-03160 [Blumeria graminis f. sp. triticale]|uniref:BgTH12-03160 n=1 Tax=Blumeria graminis f. sp. triticale TaxID=1689686 RepID=A0A9W4GFE7_BLUGR|nr:BgTH12-03160 [Blumeria graminis f. sp. triticale]
MSVGNEAQPTCSKSTAISDSNLTTAQTHDEKLVVDTPKSRRQNLKNLIERVLDSSPPNSEHQPGPSGCHTCFLENQKILEAYYNYFLSNDPNAWYEEIPEYKSAIQGRFQQIQNPTLDDLEDLNSISQSMLRKYLDKALNDTNSDNNGLRNSSMTANGDLTIGSLTNQCGRNISIERQHSYSSLNVKQLVLGLQEARTRVERALLYTQFYCTPSENDTHQQKNFKSKYARSFESCGSHEEVLEALRKEAQTLYQDKVTALRRELNELQLAQSAHLKNKARKAEKVQRLLERTLPFRHANCSFKRCGKRLDLSEENPECAVCEWLVSKGRSRTRFYYCSAKHATEDFDDHDRLQHQCSAGDRCLFFPKIGPPGNLFGAGVCLPCLESKEGLFYYCSTECYYQNFDWHAQRHHLFNHPQESTKLETITFARDMKILSQANL